MKRLDSHHPRSPASRAMVMIFVHRSSSTPSASRIFMTSSWSTTWPFSRREIWARLWPIIFASCTWVTPAWVRRARSSAANRRRRTYGLIMFASPGSSPPSWTLADPAHRPSLDAPCRSYRREHAASISCPAHDAQRPARHTPCRGGRAGRSRSAAGAGRLPVARDGRTGGLAPPVAVGRRRLLPSGLHLLEQLAARRLLDEPATDRQQRPVEQPGGPSDCRGRHRPAPVGDDLVVVVEQRGHVAAEEALAEQPRPREHVAARDAVDEHARAVVDGHHLERLLVREG